MELVNAKRLVIITEASIESAILRLIDDHGARGYTVSRDLTGRGSHGARDHFAPMSHFGENVKVEVILISEEKAEEIIAEIIDKYFSHNYAGLVYLHDVKTVKSNHF